LETLVESAVAYTNQPGSFAAKQELCEGITAALSGAAETVDAAEPATAAAIAALGGRQPRAALFFDRAATRLRIGNSLGMKLGALSSNLGNIHLAGCNTDGRIARAEGQFGGFHNCTAVVCGFFE
jgi:hypothetical protein